MNHRINHPFSHHIKQLAPCLPWLALVIATLAVGAYDHSFLAPATLIGLLTDSATLFLMAIGMTYVIYIGSIDLSMQAVAAVSSIVLALLIPQYGFAGIVVALMVGAAFGLLSGVVHGRLRIPSFIATLAVGGIVTTAARYISGDRSIEIGGELGDKVLGWAVGTTASVPDEIWVALVVVLIALTLEQATPFGKAMKAVGCNEQAARVSGIKIMRIKLMVFTLSGLLAALSGVVLAARLSSGSPTIANEFLLPAIAAVVLGGTALTGGSGGVMRTLVGTMLIAVVRTGMTFVGVNVLAQQIVFGLVLILAVGLSAGRAPKGVMK